RYQGMRAFLDALTRAGAEIGPAPARAGFRATLTRAGVVAVLLVAAGVGGALFVRWQHRDGPTTSDGRPRLAVLPFRSARPEDAYLAVGLSDEITSRVAVLSGIAVIARTSIARVAAEDRPVRDIARDLNVGYVLTGSVQADRGDHRSVNVRVIPSLQRASDGEVIWSDRYDVALAPGDLLNVQSAIAGGVASALNVSLLTEERLELAARPTSSLEAYEAYLRGNVYFSQSFSEPPWREAIAMYQRAVAADPRFAVAWARLAQANTQYYYYFDRSAARLGQARTALDRAMSLDSTLIETRLAEGLLAYLGSLDFDAAEQHFNAVRRSRPNNSEVLYYLATIQRRQGQFDEAEATLRRTLELDPRAPLYSLELATTHLMQRRYREAERELTRTLKVAPDWLAGHVTRSFLYWVWKADLDRARAALREALKTHPMREVLSYLIPVNPNYILSMGAEFQDSLDALPPRGLSVDPGFVYIAKALSKQRQGDPRARAYFDSARAAWEPRLQDRSQDWRVRIQLGLAYAGLGRKQEALREGRAAVGLLPLDQDAQAGTYPVNAMVNIAILLDELDTAIAYLRPLLAHPPQVSPQLVRADPLFMPLRAKPEFRSLTR
ncbi:MAG: tetratricopeptide repeat protein, partial [Chloroflexi bacterium]|nr:tetratricopeptide repeat protein [Chloroflexota bacterium]